MMNTEWPLLARYFLINDERMKIDVYIYFGRNGIRDYTFLVGSYHEYESCIRVRGRKRVRPEKLFKRTRLEARNLYDEFLQPNQEYSFNIPNGRLGNTDLGV